MRRSNLLDKQAEIAMQNAVIEALLHELTLSQDALVDTTSSTPLNIPVEDL